MNFSKRICISLLMLVLPVAAWGAGEEHLGNDPVSGQDYETPEGLLVALNNRNRVYRRWVNGNEKFFYRGDTIALNAFLEDFSKIKSDRLEVVLRPGPAETTTFDQETKIKYDWQLHIVGGIAAHMSKSDLGSHVWPTHPIVSVYTGGRIQLSNMEVPKNVKLLQLSDLRDRYAKSLKSTNQNVRGWTCGEIAKLDRYDAKAMTLIASMLKDEEGWVRMNAVGALKTYGAKAKPLMEKLQAANQDGDDRLRSRIETAIEEIGNATHDSKTESNHLKMVLAIQKYCTDLDTPAKAKDR